METQVETQVENLSKWGCVYPACEASLPHQLPNPPPCCRCIQEYFSYSLIILGITLFSIVSTVISTYSYRRRLAALAHYTCEVKLLQGGRVVTASSTELVPGGGWGQGSPHFQC